MHVIGDKFKLKDVATINPSKRELEQQSVQGADVSFIPMECVSNEGHISNKEVRVFSDVSKGFSYFRENDILFAKITPCMENGKGAMATGLLNGIGFGSTEFHVLRANEKIIETKYLYFILQSQHFRTLAEVHMTGSAGQKRVPKFFIENFEVLIPNKHTQLRIIRVLEKMKSIIAKRYEVISKYDTLLQAVFLSMFGDPYLNDKKLDITTMKSVISEVTNGLTRRRKEEINNGHVVLRLRDVRENEISFEGLNRIVLDEKEIRKYHVDKGDLLFIRVNGNPKYVGRCAVFDGFTEDVYFNDHIMKVKLNKEFVNPVFVSYLLNLPFGKYEINKYIKTSAGQFTINRSGLEQIKIILPELSLQDRFVDILRKVNEQRQRSLKQLEVLEENFRLISHELIFAGKCV